MSSHSVCKYSGYTLGYHVSDHPDVIIARMVVSPSIHQEFGVRTTMLHRPDSETFDTAIWITTSSHVAAKSISMLGKTAMVFEAGTKSLSMNTTFVTSHRGTSPCSSLCSIPYFGAKAVHRRAKFATSKR